MKQIRIFVGTPKEAEDKTNKWLEENYKLKIYAIEHGFSCVKGYYNVSICIKYEKPKVKI